MLFHSLDFLVFFPLVVLGYGVVPKKGRYIWLLLASYFFYMSWNPRYALLLAASTLTTYGCARLLAGAAEPGKRKLVLAAGLIANLAILVVFKYANFALENAAALFTALGVSFTERRLDLLLPVGISFYTFQALGYTLDVYRGETAPEKNLLKYALYVSFFPVLLAGPIERSRTLLPQLQKLETVTVWDFERMWDGFFLMLWGLFQKLVVADRAALLVRQVLPGYEAYGFLELLLAALLFAFQIYCDFGGYTNIARGAAKIMGIRLRQNFRQPYLAADIHQFWRRWHISLTSWFTDYLYIPLGGSRRGLKRKYLNILIVFGVSGLWHGASWNFIVWGLLHGAYQIAGDVKKRRAKTAARPEAALLSGAKRLYKTVLTFLLVDFAWVFFACDDLTHALRVFRQMGTGFRKADLLELGLSAADWKLLGLGILLLLAVDVLHERGVALFQWVSRQPLVLRWTLSMGLLWAVILFGVYGAAYDTSTFIYFQF